MKLHWIFWFVRLRRRGFIIINVYNYLCFFGNLVWIWTWNISTPFLRVLLKNIENRLRITLQLNHTLHRLFDPFIVTIFSDENFASSLIIDEHVIDPNIYVGLVHFALTERTVPLSRKLMSSYESLKANAAEVLAVSSSDGHFDSVSGVGTHQVYFVLSHFNFRYTLLQDLYRIFLFHSSYFESLILEWVRS